MMCAFFSSKMATQQNTSNYSKNFGIFQSVKKLIGQDNYFDWTEEIQACATITGLWSVLEGEPLEADTTKSLEMRAQQVMTINADVRVHFDSTDNAKNIWDKLKKIFADNSLTSRVNLLQELCTTTLTDCDSAHAYISKIITAARRLRNTDLQLSDELDASLMLAGLPNYYTPMIMAVSNSNVTITTDLIKSKIIEEASKAESDDHIEKHFLFTRNPSENQNRADVYAYAMSMIMHILRKMKILID